ncbi:MAG: hypothetical protein ACI9TH_003124 [Kiritimatiellia bacterium]|jgi:hypothetical protein
MKRFQDLTKEEQSWIETYCDETISPEAFEQFQDTMEQQTELRAAFRQYLALDAHLRDGTESKADAGAAWNDERVQPQAKVVTFSRGGFITAALGLAAMLVLGFFLTPRFRAPEPLAQTVEPTATGFGVVTGQDQVKWTSASLDEGDLLPSGLLALSQGVVQLELFSGVALVIEGDAAFEIHSAMEVTITRGKVRAHVPEPARGFRMHLPEGEVVDLGTEFAVEASAERTEIHVLDGSVEWKPRQLEKRLMQQGEALRLNDHGPAEELTATASQFVGVSELKLRLDGGREQRRQAWLKQADALTHHPDLVAYYPMNQPGGWQRSLQDMAGDANGSIVAAKRTIDRFGAPDAALDFSPAGSRVRINIKPELEALTLLTWVRIDRLDRWYNSLMLTDGHELQEPHWQIMDDGRIFFSVKAYEPPAGKVPKGFMDKHVVFSPPIWTPALSGKWLQIATSYDGGRGEVVHYVNGSEVHRETLPENMRVPLVKIGGASIGNWSEPKRDESHFAVRNFNGSMDEFAIFSTALSGAAIADLYEKGRP